MAMLCISRLFDRSPFTRTCRPTDNIPSFSWPRTDTSFSKCTLI